LWIPSGLNSEICGCAEAEEDYGKLLISSWRPRSTSYSVAPSHREGIIGRGARKTTQCLGRKIVPLNLSSLLYIMLCL